MTAVVSSFPLQLATNPTLQAAERRSAAVWSLLTGTWTVRLSGMRTHVSMSVAALMLSHTPPSGGDIE